MNSGNPAFTVTDLRGNFTLLSQSIVSSVCAKNEFLSMANGIDKATLAVLYCVQNEYRIQVMEVGCESHARPLL